MRVQSQFVRDGSAEGRHLDAVGQTGSVMIGPPARDHLCFSGQPLERPGMNDPVGVTLEDPADLVREFFWKPAPPGIAFAHGVT